MTTPLGKPLAGLRVVHLGGIGPGPFACMMLADMGAQVIRLQRPGDRDRPANPVLDRGIRSVVVDLKDPRGVAVALRILASADACVEGFRPGVAERLGLGPAEVHRINAALVYGRMTGYGQTGPLASQPGHDINYIATSGVLHGLGRAGEPPAFPANLVGDFGGGGMLLALGLTAGILRARASGTGCVVDAAMIDGSSLLWSMMYGFEARGQWSAERGVNELDSGAPYYNVYETSDGEYVAVGAIESQFFAALVTTLGIELPQPLPEFDHRDQANWPLLAEALSTAFRARTLAQVRQLFDGVSACVTPVLNRRQAAEHPHNRQRSLFLDSPEALHPAPAPRFGAVDADSGAVAYPEPELPAPAPASGADTAAVLAAAGFPQAEIDELVAARVLAGPVATPTQLMGVDRRASNGG